MIDLIIHNILIILIDFRLSPDRRSATKAAHVIQLRCTILRILTP